MQNVERQPFALSMCLGLMYRRAEKDAASKAKETAEAKA